MNLNYRIGLAFASSRRRCESGASMIELAIVLPLVLVLVSGMVDMGFAINRVKSVVSASRQAARVASSHSKFLAAAVPCGSDLRVNCSLLDPISPVPSVSEVAAHAACNYLEHNAPPSSNWDVDIPRPREIFEDGVPFFTTRVSVDFVGRPCFICMHELFGSFQPRSTSSFVLEGRCSES